MAPYAPQFWEAAKAGYKMYQSLPKRQKRMVRRQKGLRGGSNRQSTVLTKYGSARREIKKVKKKVKLIQEQNQLARHTFRRRDVSIFEVEKKVSSLNYVLINDIALLELALANLRYYDPATPGTLTTAAAGTGTYARQFWIDSVHGSFRVRNNAITAAHCTLYIVVPRKDTSLSPTTTYTQGITDADAGQDYSATSALAYPTDSAEFNDLWRIVSSKTRYLRGGQSMNISYSKGGFKYDPATTDSHNLSYQAKYGAAAVLIRLTGDITHDSTAHSEIGTGNCLLDTMLDTTYKIRYDAGTKLNDFSCDDNQNTMAANPTSVEFDLGLFTEGQ